MAVVRFVLGKTLECVCASLGVLGERSPDEG